MQKYLKVLSKLSRKNSNNAIIIIIMIIIIIIIIIITLVIKIIKTFMNIFLRKINADRPDDGGCFANGSGGISFNKVNETQSKKNVRLNKVVM